MKKIKHRFHTKEFRKIICWALIALIIGMGIGITFGVEITIQKVAKIASGFIKLDEIAVRQAITQYENNLGGCYIPQFNFTE